MYCRYQKLNLFLIFFVLYSECCKVTGQTVVKSRKNVKFISLMLAPVFTHHVEGMSTGGFRGGG
jgi:hypothetical protein